MGDDGPTDEFGPFPATVDLTCTGSVNACLADAATLLNGGAASASNWQINQGTDLDALYFSTADFGGNFVALIGPGVSEVLDNGLAGNGGLYGQFVNGRLTDWGVFVQGGVVSGEDVGLPSLFVGYADNLGVVDGPSLTFSISVPFFSMSISVNESGMEVMSGSGDAVGFWVGMTVGNHISLGFLGVPPVVVPGGQ